MNSTKQKKYLAPVEKIALAAGDLLMNYFSSEYSTTHKPDSSPVTEADIAANQYITKELLKLAPEIMVVSEEGAEADFPSSSHFVNSNNNLFWLVDPLDGTKAFIAKEPEFTVNIALIENGLPLLGVIYVPAQSLLYYGAVGVGAFRVSNGKNQEKNQEKISSRPKPKDGVTIVKSKSHPSARTEEFLKQQQVKDLISCSSSVKFCKIAEGAADIYPRFGRTMEWDTAAGHAILNAAGGRVETADGEILVYGKDGFENPHFIAYGYEVDSR